MKNEITAVQYIEEYLKHKGIIIDNKTIPQVLVGVINEAKEIEKKQIISALKAGVNFEINLNIDSNTNMTYDEYFEKYYNKTYKKNNI